MNPCLFVKRSSKGIVYVALYVDNNLMIGDKATIDDAIIAFKNKGLVLKVMEGLQVTYPAKSSSLKTRNGLGWVSPT